MAIIDEKGKFFGKVNVIDFLVIVFILFCLPMGWFGYRLFKPLKDPVERALSETATITVGEARYEELNTEYQKLNYQISNLLKEHKRLKKYFE